MDLNKRFIQLFSTCLPVKGFRRSIIIDIQRECFYFITNDLFDILKEDLPCELHVLLEKYGEENKYVIQQYIDFLFEKEVVFLTNEPERFPPLSTRWESPRKITNAIIDINKESEYNALKGIQEIDILGAEAVQIRVFGEREDKWILELLNSIVESTKRIRTIELLIKYNEGTDYTFFEANLLISSITIYCSPFNEIKRDGIYGAIVIYTKENIDNASHCGVISSKYFMPRIEHVLEAMYFNTCLNKKVSIDVNGNIKNCPSMIHSYGHIDSISISNVLDDPYSNFTSKWFISKDKVTICKDCEFRLICSDCRAYTEGDDYSKPLKCSYNPYTLTWES